MLTSEERFLAKVQPNSDDECWMWIGAKGKNGYGRFSRDGQTLYAHRIAYERAKGPISSDTKGYIRHPLTTNRGITARDRNDVFTADLMIANLLNATEKVCGTAVEFGWADAMNVPIILVIEEEGSIAEHPILDTLAGFRTSSLEEAAELARAILLP